MIKNLLLAICLLVVVENATAQIVFGKNRQTSNSGGSTINYSSPKEYEIADIEVSGVE